MPHLRARIRSNSSFAFFSQLVRLLSNLLLFVGVARYYGVESFGQFTTAHTLSTLFLLAADFGFDTLLPTQLAVNRQAGIQLVRRYLSLKVLFALTATVAMVLLSFRGDFGRETALLIRIFSAYVFLGAVANFFFAVFKGFDQFHHETRISFVTSVILLLLLAALGALRVSIVLIAAAFVATRIGTVALCLRQARRIVGPEGLGFTLRGWREIVPRVVVFGLHFLFGNLFYQLDTILLSLYQGDRVVGFYQGAFKIAILALIIPDIAVTSVLPALSDLHHNNNLRWLALGKLLNKVLFLSALPISLVLFAFPAQILNAVYGAGSFAEAIPVLRVFALVVFVRFCVDGYAVMMTSADRQGERMIIVMGGTILNVALNVVVIPQYGGTGAAWVSLATNVAVGIAYIVRSKMSFVHWNLEVRSVILLGLTAVAAGVASGYGSSPLWLSLSIVVVCYGVLLIWVGLQQSERRLLFGPAGMWRFRPTDPS